MLSAYTWKDPEQVKWILPVLSNYNLDWVFHSFNIVDYLCLLFIAHSVGILTSLKLYYRDIWRGTFK